MRINTLKIEGFNILDDDFFIDFNGSTNLSILIGKNGSGKSSIIEAIGIIFTSLYKGSKPPFYFVIDYDMFEQKLGIQYTEEQFTIRVNGNVYFLNDMKYLIDIGVKIIPDNIITYYSGSNLRLKKIFSFGKYVESPFLYVEDKQFKLIFLTLLSSNLESHRNFLNEHFMISRKPNFLVELKIKFFSTKFINTLKIIDHAFMTTMKYTLTIRDLLTIIRQDIQTSHYDSTEEILKELDELWQKIAVNDVLKECLDLPYRLNKNVFSIKLDNEVLENLIYQVGGEIDFFKSILNLMSRDLLIDTKFEFEKNTNTVDYTCLSEGEKQLITVVGIKELIAGESNLFLLDEPDTYLHPSWQNILINNFSQTSNNYTILTTHSANILKNISKKHIFILKNENNKINVFDPPKSTFGRDVNSILNEVMGVEERNGEIDKLLDSYFEAISKKAFTDAESIKNQILSLAQQHDEEFFAVDEPEFIRANAIIERMKILGR